MIKYRGGVYMFPEVKKVTFFERRASGEKDTFELNKTRTRNTLRVIAQNSNLRQTSKRVEVSDEIFDSFVENLIPMVNNWQRTYLNLNTMGQVEWELNILTKDGGSYYYRGVDKFPGNYNRLKGLIRKMKIETQCFVI